MKVGEKVDHSHNIDFDYRPTSFVESPGEAIRAGSFVTRHRFDGPNNLLLRKILPKNRKIAIGKNHARPIEITMPRLL
jgi:hypothetical protein